MSAKELRKAMGRVPRIETGTVVRFKRKWARSATGSLGYVAIKAPERWYITGTFNHVNQFDNRTFFEEVLGSDSVYDIETPVEWEFLG